MPIRVLQIVGDLPTKEKPHNQPFIKSQITSLENFDVKVDIYNLTKLFGNNFMKYIKGTLNINKQLVLNKYDLIHAHYSYCGGVAIFQNSVPVIVSLMGSDLLGDTRIDGTVSVRGRMDQFITKLIYSKVDHVIVKSESMLNAYHGKKDVSILPNGVDFDLFKPMDQNEAKKKLGLNENDKSVLFAGNPTIKRKNIKLAEEAFEYVSEEVPNAKLLVFFNRPQNDLAIAMNAADVLVLTSHGEGSPNVVKEALASNLPIVSVNAGDVKERIKDVSNCYICNYDPKEIGSRIVKVLSSCERSNGREKSEYLRIELVAEKLIGIYKEVLFKFSIKQKGVNDRKGII